MEFIRTVLEWTTRDRVRVQLKEKIGNLEIFQSTL